jgi:hypothetical protein
LIVLFLVLAIFLILSRPRTAAVWPSQPDRVVILVVLVVGTGTLTLGSAAVKPPPRPEASPLAWPKALNEVGGSEDATSQAPGQLTPEFGASPETELIRRLATSEYSSGCESPEPAALDIIQPSHWSLTILDHLGDVPSGGF